MTEPTTLNPTDDTTPPIPARPGSTTCAWSRPTTPPSSPNASATRSSHKPGAAQEVRACDLRAVRGPGQPWGVVEGGRPIGTEAQPLEAHGLLGLAFPEKPQHRAVRIRDIHDRFIRAALL